MSVQNHLNRTQQTNQTWDPKNTDTTITSPEAPETTIEPQNATPTASNQGRLGILKYGEGADQSIALPPIARPVITVAKDIKLKPQNSGENTTALIQATSFSTAPLPESSRARDPQDPRTVLIRGFTATTVTNDKPINDIEKLERLSENYPNFMNEADALLVNDQETGNVIQLHPIKLDEAAVENLLKASKKPNGKWALEVLRNQATKGIYKASVEAIVKAGKAYSAPLMPSEQEKALSQQLQNIFQAAQARLDEQAKKEAVDKNSSKRTGSHKNR